MMNIFAVLYKISFINMNNFDELNKSKYAQMQSSIFNKAGSSIVSSSSGFGTPSKLNLTGKFAGIEETVRSVENDSHILTQAARESRRTIQQMKRVVAEKQLGQYKTKCTEQVKKYERVVSYGIAQNNKRTQQMWNKCKDLNGSTQDLKNSVTLLHNRLNKLENVLGYYSGAEIVSNY